MFEYRHVNCFNPYSGIFKTWREVIPHSIKKSEPASAHVSQFYVIAHSMGNQILLNAIDKASREAERPSLNEVVLAEPDVALERFVQSGHLLTDVAKDVTLYASSTDTALLASIKWNGGGQSSY
jgi:esterase/lipase superfamily enzyme